MIATREAWADAGSPDTPIAAFPGCKVLIDHMCNPKSGMIWEYGDVLDLARRAAEEVDARGRVDLLADVEQHGGGYSDFVAHREELRALVDPRLEDIVGELTPDELAPALAGQELLERADRGVVAVAHGELEPGAGARGGTRALRRARRRVDLHKKNALILINYATVKFISRTDSCVVRI